MHAEEIQSLIDLGKLDLANAVQRECHEVRNSLVFFVFFFLQKGIMHWQSFIFKNKANQSIKPDRFLFSFCSAVAFCLKHSLIFRLFY